MKRLLSKKIPTLIGILFLIGGLGVGIFVVNEGTGGFLPKASPETTPKNVRVTNVTESSFTVSFMTDTATPGFVKHGIEPNNLNTQTTDDRDQLTGTVGSFTTHHITVRGLNPATRYYAVLGTGSRDTFMDNGQPYTITTAPRLGVSPESSTAYGTILSQAQTPATDAIVYLEIDGAAPLSALVRSSGSWAIPIGTGRTTDLSQFISINPSAGARIFVQGRDLRTTASLNDTLANSQPFPVITLGQDAGARTTTPGSSTPATTPTPAPQTAVPENPQLSIPAPDLTAQAEPVEFTNPSTEGEQINSVRPELKGTAPPNTTLSITIESTPVYQGTVQTDANGNWSYTPPGDLAPGTHTITVSYAGANGVQQSQQRTFTILAQGTSTNPAFTSTPSATTQTPATSSASATSSAQTTATTSGSTDSARVTIATGSPTPTPGGLPLTLAITALGGLFIGFGLLGWQRLLLDARKENTLR